MKIGIIILNYLAYQTTMNTIEAFLTQEHDGIDMKYIIVDNCSPNESYDKLREAYAKYSDIIVVKTEKNAGFANGNNFGYQELLKHMDPDFVIVSNDDILLPQPGLYRWIEECHKKYKFDVLGPDVYSINGKYHQSPMQRFTQDSSQCKKKVSELKKCYIKCKIKQILHCSKYSQPPQWENTLYKEFHDDHTLHGSFLIFATSYFQHFDTPFDPRTFLYFEEDILRVRCDKNGLRCVYDPTYKIHHLQAVSTNMIHKNPYKKEQARLKHLIKSMEVYTSILYEYID